MSLLANGAPKPGSSDAPRASHAPLYAEALRRFLAGERDLEPLAVSVGLRADRLVTVATRADWWARASAIDRGRAIAADTDRACLAIRADAALVSTATDHVERIGSEWRALTSRVLTVPADDPDIAPDDTSAAAWRGRIKWHERRATLLRTVSQGVRDMGAVALELGLARGERLERGDGEGRGKLDMSRLTQLNVTINAALAQLPAEARPVIDLPELEPTAISSTDNGHYVKSDAPKAIGVPNDAQSSGDWDA